MDLAEASLITDALGFGLAWPLAGRPFALPTLGESKRMKAARTRACGRRMQATTGTRANPSGRPAAVLDTPSFSPRFPGRNKVLVIGARDSHERRASERGGDHLRCSRRSRARPRSGRDGNARGSMPSRAEPIDRRGHVRKVRRCADGGWSWRVALDGVGAVEKIAPPGFDVGARTRERATYGAGGRPVAVLSARMRTD